jgi:Flp pilus assembly protein CpaB
MATRTASSKTLFRRRGSSNILGHAILGACVLAAAFMLTVSRKQVEVAKVINPVVTDFDSVQLLVPEVPVAAGTRIKDIRFKKVSYPRHQVPSGALTNFELLSDSVVIAPLPANLPMFQENLSTVGHIANPVLDKIPLGMRAMTIRVDATSSVEGWAGSGSVVDILLIEKDRTSVVAEKVRILSAERSVAPVEGQASPTVPSTVTLLVTQDQCLAINTAIPLGKIAFALRSARDEQSWSDPEFKSSELMTKQIFDKDPTGNVKGVISFKGDEKEKAFALTDGKWIKTDVMPQGFFVNGEE